MPGRNIYKEEGGFYCFLFYSSVTLIHLEQYNNWLHNKENKTKDKIK